MALTHILGLTLIPVAATMLGGAITVFRVPSDRTRSLVQHFAAGVIMAVVAGELLPGMTRKRRPVGVLIGFTLGVALMLGVKALAERIERSNEQTARGKAELLIAVGVDMFLDGLLIGAGLAALVVLGALLGVSFLSGLTGMALEIVLSFGAAARMYLVVEELLTEAHEVKETPLITASFFAGFVALYLLELLA